MPSREVNLQGMSSVLAVFSMKSLAAYTDCTKSKKIIKDHPVFYWACSTSLMELWLIFERNSNEETANYPAALTSATTFALSWPCMLISIW